MCDRFDFDILDLMLRLTDELFIYYNLEASWLFVSHTGNGIRLPCVCVALSLIYDFVIMELFIEFIEYILESKPYQRSIYSFNFLGHSLLAMRRYGGCRR